MNTQNFKNVVSSIKHPDLIWRAASLLPEGTGHPFYRAKAAATWSWLPISKNNVWRLSITPHTSSQCVVLLEHRGKFILLCCNHWCKGNLKISHKYSRLLSHIAQNKRVVQWISILINMLQKSCLLLKSFKLILACWELYHRSQVTCIWKKM